MELAEIKDLLAQTVSSLRKTEKLTQENALQMKQFNRQLGELGNKFGSFAEGMALNSVSKILSEQFDVQMAAWRVKRKNKQTNEWLELDYFGYENSSVNRVVIVEMKSHLRHKDLEKVERMATRFREFFPEHTDKQLFVIIAYIDYEDNDTLAEAREKGFYLASVNDSVFTLQSPPTFVGRDFNQ